MGAYNNLRTSIQCYNCDHSFTENLQVHIGWCRWEQFVLGDEIVWMEPENRKKMEELQRSGKELRSVIEIGSKNWRNFILSAGDCTCPNCYKEGTVLVIVKNNIFHMVAFTPKRFAYAEVLFEKNIDEFLLQS